ncbi:MAG: VanW family protein [Clostridia bacterium]
MKEKTMEEEKNIDKKEFTNDSNVIEEKNNEKKKEMVEENKVKDSKEKNEEKSSKKEVTKENEKKHENKKEKHLKKESKKDKDEKNKDKESKFKKIEDNKKAKSEFEKMQDQKEQTIKKRKKRKKAIIISLILVILIAIFSTIFAFININNEKIISGVTIKGIEVSGLTKEEAMAKLETIYSEKLEKDLKLKYGEYESELNPTLMEVKYDIENAVNEAYLLGKDGNIFVNNYKILSTLIQKKDINVNMTLNEEVTKQTINDMGQNLPGIMLESSYTIEGNKLIITKGKDGIVIDTDTLLNKVKNTLNNINKTEEYIEIPTTNKSPTPIDIDKIHSEVYKEAKDAYYTKNPFTVYPEVEGVDFDVEAAKKMIETENKEEYVIQLKITKPKVTIDQIGPEAFPDQLSTFKTRYDASDKDRTTNLILACKKLDGKVIMPGETFSYNATLGPRSTATGYKNAKVYENGEVVDGIGGGICQISSTLYNAALMADMEIVERRNHQFVTSYVGAGRDATVVYGLTDFKFKNTRKYPIKLKASSVSGIATISIFGIKEEEREYTYTFKTNTISTIPFTTKYVEDASLQPGQEIVKQKGANGLVTQTYMTKMKNGKVISSQLLSKDTYSAMQKIIRRGKAKTTVQENKPVENKEESNDNKTQNKVETNTQNENKQENIIQ